MTMRPYLRLTLLLPIITLALAVTLVGQPALAGPAPAPAASQPAVEKDADQLRTRGLPNPLQASTIPQLIGRVTQIFTGIVGSIALLMFVYGGLLWMTSRGNSEQIDKGRRIFVWSTIGMAIMFSSYLIIKLFLQSIEAVQ